jgi:hypothetical protein
MPKATVEFLLGDLRQWFLYDGAGVVDHDIHAPERGECFVEHPFDDREIGQIARHQNRPRCPFPWRDAPFHRHRPANAPSHSRSRTCRSSTWSSSPRSSLATGNKRLEKLMRMPAHDTQNYLPSSGASDGRQPQRERCRRPFAGHGAWRAIPSATPPGKRCAIPPRPCVAQRVRSMSAPRAKSGISPTGGSTRTSARAYFGGHAIAQQPGELRHNRALA